jgi:hypothetical protein
VGSSELVKVDQFNFNRVVLVDHKLPVAAAGQHTGSLGRTRLMAKKAAAKKAAAKPAAAPAKKSAAKKAAKKK